jgi:hypothetical protein
MRLATGATPPWRGRRSKQPLARYSHRSTRCSQRRAPPAQASAPGERTGRARGSGPASGVGRFRGSPRRTARPAPTTSRERRARARMRQVHPVLLSPSCNSVQVRVRPAPKWHRIPPIRSELRSSVGPWVRNERSGFRSHFGLPHLISPNPQSVILSPLNDRIGIVNGNVTLAKRGSAESASPPRSTGQQRPPRLRIPKGACLRGQPMRWSRSPPGPPAATRSQKNVRSVPQARKRPRYRDTARFPPRDTAPKHRRTALVEARRGQG